MRAMTIRLPASLRLLALGAVLALGACGFTTATVDDTSRVAAVGRISDIEVQHGYATVEFPNGRMNVSMDKRELEQYRIGDQLRIDSYGRPLPRR
jgi:hypothetical protein